MNPIVAGLEDGEPVLASYDSIGCMAKDAPIQCGGTAFEMLLGGAEAFSKKDMTPEEIEEVTAQVLLSGCDRDASSGWGGQVYVLYIINVLPFRLLMYL